MQGRNFRDREVVGSNPIAPIFRISNLRASRDARFAFAVTFAATLGLEEHRGRREVLKNRSGKCKHPKGGWDLRYLHGVEARACWDAIKIIFAAKEYSINHTVGVAVFEVISAAAAKVMAF